MWENTAKNMYTQIKKSASDEKMSMIDFINSNDILESINESMSDTDLLLDHNSLDEQDSLVIFIYYRKEIKTMWIEETKTGNFKFVEYYTDPVTGKKRRTSVTYSKNTTQTRKQAIKELEKKIAEKTTNNAEDILVEDAIDMFLKYKEKEIKLSTLELYISCLKQTKNAMEGVYLNKLNQIYLRQKIDEYKLSKISIHVLKMFFSWAYSEGLLTHEIYENIKRIRMKNIESKNKTSDILYYEKYEIVEILKKLDNGKTYTEQVTRLIIEFLILTGLRIGELLALNENDLNDYKLSINKRVYTGAIDAPKTKSSNREIALNSRAMQIISETKFLKRIHGLETNLIFPSEKGKFLSPTTIRDKLKKNNVSSKLHIFRHTHASILAEEGLSYEIIQRRLGHENDEITKKIYIHVTEKTKKREEEIFKNLDIL